MAWLVAEAYGLSFGSSLKHAFVTLGEPSPLWKSGTFTELNSFPTSETLDSVSILSVLNKIPFLEYVTCEISVES